MHRIETLIVILFAITVGHAARAQSNGDIFFHYRDVSAQKIAGDPTSPDYWSARYDLQRLVYSALENDVKDIFKNYLQGHLPLPSEVSALLTRDPYLKDNFPVASSTVLMQESVREIERSLGEIELTRKIKFAHATNQLVPLHFRVFDDEATLNEAAYFERGTHKIKMALDKINRENWLTWFVHEHLHFFDPILQSGEVRVDEAGRISQIANWVRTQHHDLTPNETLILNQYFSDLTSISIQAEWRAWIATSVFAQELLAKGGLSSIPPCLAFLSSFGFGSRMLSESELKTLWWTKLREGFFVAPTELFTDPWLKAKLIQFTASLNPDQLPTGNLSKLIDQH